MQIIEAILFDPAGCLAEFPDGSRITLYEDVVPALAELKQMGIRLFIASSLPGAVVKRFLEDYCLTGFFTGVWTGAWTRDNAIDVAALTPDRTIFLTDTAEGLAVAKSLGFNAILMMNDPEKAKRLAMFRPAGGIVSLHELPDFIRFVAAQLTPLPSP
jgi:phosphoglycolate phosphatase-like HAD superfamily hydrolase